MSVPRYLEYKDSGVEWLGDVPAHWEIAPLKREFSVVGGSTPKSDVEAFWDGEIVWVSPADLGKLSSMVISESQRTITKEGLASCGTTLVPKGSIVLSTRAPIGSLAISGKELCTNQGCKSLVPRRANSQFYAYLLSICTEALNIRGKGTTFLELSGDELGAFRVPVPTAEEQVAIAHFLEVELCRIDGLVAEQEKLIALLKEKRQAVISHAVTKGLDPSVPMKDSGIEWLGKVPSHWEIKRIKRHFRMVKRQEGADLEVLSVYREYGVIKKSSRDDNINKTPEDLSLYQTVRPGDLVINKMKAWQGSLGISDHEGITSPDYVVFEPTHHEVAGFLHYFLRSPRMPNVYRSISNGIRPDQWRLEPDKFEQLLIALPPLPEQIKIFSFLKDSLDAIDNLVGSVEKAISLLSERRCALISAAVTGKIDVRQLTSVEAA